jgi:hypothetical protein
MAKKERGRNRERTEQKEERNGTTQVLRQSIEIKRNTKAATTEKTKKKKERNRKEERPGLVFDEGKEGGEVINTTAIISERISSLRGLLNEH